MKRIYETNNIYQGANGKKSLYDLEIPEKWNKKCIIFIHGYMGYKDWGAWNLLQDFFTNHQYGFLKYNVSHNGGSINQAIDFPDLDSFRKNNYSKELVDLRSILNLAKSKLPTETKFYLIGHSRGGGIAALESGNTSLTKIALLAPISSIEKRFPTGDALTEWKKNGVYYRTNGRTNQEMPHDYSQFTDFLENKSQLDIQAHCLNAKIPIHVIHGENDTSVSPEEGKMIANWSKGSIEIIPGTAHTFGAKQPWLENKLPLALEQACESILIFFNNE